MVKFYVFFGLCALGIWKTAVADSAINPGAIESLTVGDSLSLPSDFRLDQLDLSRQRAWRTLKDAYGQGSCTMALSKSQAPVTIQKLSDWRITRVASLVPTPADCRERAHRDLKARYDRAQQVLDEDWMTDSPVNRSLYKRRASEIYLKSLDRVNAAKNACTELLSKSQKEEVAGPAWLILENSQAPGRQLSLWCDRRGVSLDVLKEAGLAIARKNPETPRPAARSLAPASKASAPAFR